MKKKVICFSICCMLLMFLSGCRTVRNALTFHEHEGYYEVKRINSDTNPCKSKQYIFFENRHRICCYWLEDQKEDIILQADDWIGSYDIQDNWIYYVKDGQDANELWKKNIITEEEKILYTNEHLSCVGIYGNNIFYSLSYSERGKKVTTDYLCPIAGDLYTDSVDLDTLFPVDSSSGKDEMVIYDGIKVSKYHNEEKGYYRSNNIREVGTNYPIIANLDEAILVGKEAFIFWKESKNQPNFYYKKEGKEEACLIDCLQKKIYKYSDIFEEHLTEEDGKIIGLVAVSQDPRCSRELYQGILENDVLFQVDPETGENTILYQTKNNRTRIIGYQNGTVYLMRNYQIYSQSIRGGRKKKLFQIPEGKNYIFDWQADYLIVLEVDISNDNVVITYKID